MKASIGRTIIVKGIESNGANEQPAIITRVWSEKDTREAPVMVNVTVLPDCAAPINRGSIMLHDDRAAAEAWIAAQPAGHKPVAAFWPDRV